MAENSEAGQGITPHCSQVAMVAPGSRLCSGQGSPWQGTRVFPGPSVAHTGSGLPSSRAAEREASTPNHSAEEKETKRNKKKQENSESNSIPRQRHQQPDQSKKPAPEEETCPLLCPQLSLKPQPGSHSQQHSWNQGHEMRGVLAGGGVEAATTPDTKQTTPPPSKLYGLKYHSQNTLARFYLISS